MFSFQVQKHCAPPSGKMALTESINESKNGKDPPRGNHEEIQISTPSGLSDLQMQSTEVGEIAEMPDYETLSTSAVLHYCKHKILRPYLRLLGLMGLRPASSGDSGGALSYCILMNIHTFQVTIFMCLGYILQYMACFRRDRGFCYKSSPPKFDIVLNASKELPNDAACCGNVIFSYLIPSILHLVAFLYTIYLFRIKENEQLQNLMERAFLLSSNPANRGNQRKLVQILWLFIALSVVWMIVALVTVNIMMAQGNILFQWLEHSPYHVKVTLKVFLIICTLWHDMVQGTIITSYCLQGQLLLAHLYFLRGKLLHHTLPPIDWMREICEFKKLLKYFNDELGPAVCIYTVVNVSWAAAGIIWLFHPNNNNGQSSSAFYIGAVNVGLWILISAAPFIQTKLNQVSQRQTLTEHIGQEILKSVPAFGIFNNCNPPLRRSAARLTTACSMIQSIGHEVRIRPFVYQSTPGEDLDTILLYTSSLKMCARLFRVPITGRYLCLLLTIGSIVILTLGQCQYF